MGFDEGQILFDHENLTYYAGEVVHGKLVFDQGKYKTFRGIYIKMKGECHIHWTTRHTRRVNDRDEHYTVDHNSHEKYFEQKVYLIGGPSGEVHLQPGHHEFPFQCVIPETCPSSFERENGNIRYTFKAVVDRSMKFDQEKIRNITVIKQKDLNREPYCKEPIVFEFQETYCCWCMSAGNCDITVTLPQGGYCAGDTMKFDVNCVNNSNVEVDALKFELSELISFRATHNPDTRHESNVLAKLVKGPIAGGTTRNWTLEMDIPQRDVYNLDTCNYIDIDHCFEVKVNTSGCHSDTDATRKIVLGHIPLREFDDAPPQPNIVPQPIAPQMSQFPGTQAYPGNHPAYHNSTPAHPYPGANPGYPVNPGYPAPNSPYPPNPYPNSPYPGANPPYPMGNLPMVSPVPGANPPGVTSLYPGASPYPGGNMGVTSPYPAPNAMQPGFAMPGSDTKDPINMPLLPPTVHMPYPPNPQIVSSPYATASAPEPNTPDFKNDNPPFNPEMTKQQN